MWHIGHGLSKRLFGHITKDLFRCGFGKFCDPTGRHIHWSHSSPFHTYNIEYSETKPRYLRWECRRLQPAIGTNRNDYVIRDTQMTHGASTVSYTHLTLPTI